MNLKKINALLGLLTAASLTGHAGTMGVSLWTGWYNFSLCKSLAKSTVLFMFLHAVVSIGILFFHHDGGQMKYGRLNRSTALQRDTAIAILVLIHVHTKAYAHMTTGAVLSTGQTAMFCVTELLYFAAVMTHTAVSLSKAAVTLGLVRSGEAVKRIDRVVWTLCGLAMLILSGGMLSFFLGDVIG